MSSGNRSPVRLPPLGLRSLAMTLGEQIDAVIKAKGLKQVLVAHDVGITAASLNNIIKGKTKNPSFWVVVRIARVIGEPVSALAGDPVEYLLGYERIALHKAAKIITDRIPLESGTLRSSLLDAEEPMHAVEEHPAAAGLDAEVYADAEELPKRQIPDDLYKKKGVRHVFLVHGESMTGAGINDGDRVYVEPRTDTLRANGKIVVCRYAGFETVKRLEIRDRTIRLISENPKYKPRVVNEEADRFKLVGVVVAHLTYL